MPNRLRKQLIDSDETAGYKSPPRYAWKFCSDDARRAANKTPHPHPLRSCQVPHSPKPHPILRPHPHHLETIEEEQSRSFQTRSYSLSSDYTDTASSVSTPWSHWSSPPSSVPESPPKHLRSAPDSKAGKSSWWNRSPKFDDFTWSPWRSNSDSSNDATPRERSISCPESRTTHKVRFCVPFSPKTSRLPKSPHPFGPERTPSALTRGPTYLPEGDSSIETPENETVDLNQGISSNYHVDFPIQALPPHSVTGSEADKCDGEAFGYSALEPSSVISPASTFRGSEFSPVSPASNTQTRRSSLDSPEYAYKRKGSIGLDSPAFNLPSPVDPDALSQTSPTAAQQLQQEKEWIWRLKETNVASKAKAVKAREIDVGTKGNKGVGLGILIAKPGTGETEYKAFPSPAVKSPMWEAIARRVGESGAESTH